MNTSIFKISKNKKSQLVGTMLFVLLFAIVIIMIWFSSVRGKSEKSLGLKDITGETKKEIDDNQRMMLFLKTKIKEKDGLSNVADLIVWSYINDNYTLLENITYSNFAFNDDWKIELRLMPDNIEIAKNRFLSENAKICEGWWTSAALAYAGGSCLSIKTTSPNSIPLLDQDKYIQVNLKRYDIYTKE